MNAGRRVIRRNSGLGQLVIPLVALGILLLFNLLRDPKFFSIGLSLGADVPFCLNPFPARVQGIGEQILPVQIYEPAFLVVMKPPQSLSTPLVFRAFDKAEHSAASSDPEAGVKALKNQRYGELFRIFRS